MQLPTARVLVCHLSSEWNCPRVISQTLFITALSRKPLPEESHWSDSILWVNPALEGHSHLRGRKQEEEAS